LLINGFREKGIYIGTVPVPYYFFICPFDIMVDRNIKKGANIMGDLINSFYSAAPSATSSGEERRRKKK